MDNRVHTFAKNISSKVNVIAQLELELAYYDFAVQHVNHYATGTSPCWRDNNTKIMKMKKTTY